MAAPIITSISPAEGAVNSNVIITGSGFTGAAAVNFGVVASINYKVDSDTQITAPVPQLDPGEVSVVVTVPEQGNSNGFPFTIIKPTVINSITIVNNSGLDTSQYTLWVAGYIQQGDDKVKYFLYLKGDGTFGSALLGQKAAEYISVNNGMTIQVPNVKNLGNNRLTFTITNNGTTPPPLSPTQGYTAYPFKFAPGVCPPGPYDIFEFGPNAEYNVSAVDAFGINLSFTVKGDPLTYGANPAVTRQQIGEAYASFVESDPYGGNGFAQLLYTSPTQPGYPILVEDQYSAIVSPKDWLAIYPTGPGLINYWDNTVNALFAAGNQINMYLNAAIVGTYAGTCDGTQYTLYGPNGTIIVIPASDFTGNQGFIQAVREQNSNESDDQYKTFSQIEAAIFEAISRGVVLDGIKPAGQSIPPNYSSDAWLNTSNWFNTHNNSYNGKPSVYDVYAKFLHYATVGSNPAQNVFSLNAAGTFGMAYGFSLDENPNVGDTWPSNENVPSKTIYNVSQGQDVTLTIGKWE